jgi:hypothetical protein
MPKTKIAGWVVSGIVAAVMILAGSGKLFGGVPAEVVENLKQVGLFEEIMIIGFLEVATAILFLIPRTASAGTLLVCSFWGGAIVMHLAAGDGGYGVPLILGGLTWLGAYLRVPGAFASLTGDAGEVAA